jgi:hypothetical protein
LASLVTLLRPSDPRAFLASQEPTKQASDYGGDGPAEIDGLMPHAPEDTPMATRSRQSAFQDRGLSSERGVFDAFLDLIFCREVESEVPQSSSHVSYG